MFKHLNKRQFLLKIIKKLSFNLKVKFMVKKKFQFSFEIKKNSKNGNIKKLYVDFFFLLVRIQNKHCLNKNVVNSSRRV